MSRKNKGKFGKGKSQVEEQDEFVSGVQRIAQKLSPYKWRILTFAGIVVIGVGGISGFRHCKNVKAENATEIHGRLGSSVSTNPDCGKSNSAATCPVRVSHTQTGPSRPAAASSSC